MSAVPEAPTRLERRPMAFEDYLALPEGTRAEYVDGEVIVSPAPTSAHQQVARRLANLLEASLPGLYVVEAVGVWTAERRSRIPDVVATDEPFDDSWAPTTPVLVAEVLSHTTRGEDTLRKSVEYCATGVEHYWLVDREERTLSVLGNTGGAWNLLLELDADRPRGSVAVGGRGTVDVDLSRLLAP